MAAAVAAATAVPTVLASTVSPSFAAPAVADADGNVTLVVGTGSSAVAAERVVERLDDSSRVDLLESSRVGKAGAVSVTVPAEDQKAAVALLRADPNVKYVEPVAVFTPTDVAPDDPYYSLQWGVQKVKAPAAWDKTTGSAGTVVAVLDTGVNPVSELSGRVLPGFDFHNNDSDPADDDGHGTNATTVATAAGGNGAGIAGVCWSCKILPVKVMGRDPATGKSSGYSDVIAKGITWAADQGADVINLSLGGPTYTRVMADAVAYALSKDVIVVASAGNSNVSSRSYPAGYDGVISVGASEKDDTKTSYSNFNSAADPWISVAAPGTNAAQNAAGSYVYFSGTSSAGPVVAGIAGLARSLKPSVSVAEFRTALEGSAVPVAGGWVRNGRVDAAATLAALPGVTPPPPPPVLDKEKPVVSSAGVPSGVVRGKVTLAAVASDNVGVTDLVYRVVLNGATTTMRPSAPTAPLVWDTQGASGVATVVVTALDAAGNSGQAQATVTVDNTAPNSGAKVLSATPSGVVVQLADPSPDTAKVELLHGTSVVATATASPWLLTWAPAGGSVPATLGLRVTDVAGNQAAGAVTVFVVDNAGPEISFPESLGGLLRGKLAITPTVSDVSGVQSVRATFTHNGKVVGVASASRAPWTLAFVSDAVSGDVVMTVTATDTTGRVSTAEKVLNIDNTAPSANLLLPRTGTGVLSGVLDNPSADTALVELMVGGKLVARSTAAPWRVELDTAGKSGQMTVEVRVTDRAGNVGKSRFAVTADNTAPNLRWNTPTVGATTFLRGEVVVKATAQDASGIASLVLRVPGQEPQTMTGGGPYTFRVPTTGVGAQDWALVATDVWGLSTTVVKRVQVDNIAPAITSLPASVVTVPATFTMNPAVADEGSSVKSVQYHIGSKLVATTTAGKAATIASRLAPGTAFILSITVTDAAGNSSVHRLNLTVAGSPATRR